MQLPRYFIGHPKRFVIFIAAIAALGGLLFGFDTGVIAGALLFIKKEFNPSIWQQEFIVSATVLGALFGAITSGRLADGYGRRHMLIATSITFIIGTAIACFAPSIPILILGRFILGLAIGVASYTAPLFISEMAPPRIRGALVLFYVVAITGGEAISYLIDLYFSNIGNWRGMLAIGFIPAFLLLIGMLFSPSSPRWLFLAGKKLEALKVLSQIRKPKQIARESKAIEENLLIKQGCWRDVFSKKVWPVLIIGLVLGIGQQFVGSNTVFYYGPIIFAKVGLKGAYAQILGTFGLGLINTIFTIFTIMTVDRWGRRTLLISGTLAAAISLAALGLLLNGTDTTWSIYSSVFCLVTYVAGYAISLGALLWLIIAEIFPLNIRGLSMSFVAGVQWGANFIVASTFLTILASIGSRYTFWIYGFMSLLACLFSYFYVPETKGVSLEEIEKNLELGKPSRELGRPIEKGYI